MKLKSVLEMKDKRGLILGGFITDFFMIIFVVLLILLFLLGSSFVRKLDDSEGGIRVRNEGKVGLGGIDDYMNKDYVKIVNLRVGVGKGESVTTALGGQDG